MWPRVSLREVSRDDVSRLCEWLQDEDVNNSWYGCDDSGDPVHVGYTPKITVDCSSEEWQHTFDSDERKIYSICDADGEHIGEGQLVMEPEVRSAHMFILIGRKDLWYQHYGASAMVHLLDEAFSTHGAHRVWLAVPQYNEPARFMCERIGFVLEGRLRRRQQRGGEWYDSLSMGLLADEYVRRRPGLLEQISSGS